MIWFWLGFFCLVAFLLYLDLGVLHRKQHGQTMRGAVLMTLGWIALGLAFSGFVYLMYEYHWLGAHQHGHHTKGEGLDAVITYLSAYVLEYALSVDNLFVIALTFAQFKGAQQYQHRELFWGMLGVTFFGLLLTPVFYVAIRRVNQRWQNRRGRTLVAEPHPTVTADK